MVAACLVDAVSAQMTGKRNPLGCRTPTMTTLLRIQMAQEVEEAVAAEEAKAAQNESAGSSRSLSMGAAGTIAKISNFGGQRRSGRATPSWRKG